jgi:signal transduction histidine kinase
MTATVSAGPTAADATPQPAADTAVARGERTLAAAVAVSRVGGVAVLAADTFSWHRAAFVTPTSPLVAIALVDSVVVISVCLATGRIWRGLAAADMLCVIALVTVTLIPAAVPGPSGESPFYNYAVVSTLTFGVAPWRLEWTVLGTLALALANIVSALQPDTTYLLWNAIPDSVTFVAVGAVAWALAQLVRVSYRALDRHHQLALTRANALAVERERLRQQLDLGSHLLAAVDELDDDSAVTDARAREQIRTEREWLRRLVTSGHTESAAVALPALRDLVAEKAAAGLHIDLFLPESEPTLRPGVAGALVDATREALTNVAKHAGVRRAMVTVRVTADGLEVEIFNSGRGFDPSATTGGIGQRRSIRERIETVGGRAKIESSRGSGTRVTLWASAAGAFEP